MASSEHAVPISLHRLNRVLLPIGEASGLPNAAYVDEGYFYYERDQVIGRTWAGLAFADSIPNRPYAQPVEFMGLPLLITRDRSGVLRVFHNVCSHRGMKLVAEPTEVQGVINCRYHCWAYAVNGDLKATPHVFAVEGMQQGRASPGYQGGVFSPVMDQPTHHFHRWVAAKLAAGVSADRGE